MTRFWILTTILLIAFLTFGCGNSDDTALIPTMSEGTPGALLAPSPNSSGPIVVRSDGVPYVVLTNDPSRNLMSVHVLVSDIDLCGGSTGFDLIDTQEVSTPAQAEQMILLYKGSETNVGVYGTSDFSEFWSDPCGFIAGPKKLAEGTARFTAVGVFTTGANQQQTLKWEGFLTAVGGGTVHYNEVLHAVYDEETWDWKAEDILLRPVPGR